MASAPDHHPYRPRHAVLRIPLPGPGGTVAWRGVLAAGLAAVLTLGGASASHAARHSAPASPAAGPARALPQLPLTPQMLSRGAPVGARLLPAKPVHVAEPAPATKPVIAGLAANGIPNVALNAYRLAAARVASADPACGIGWPLLAAIGRVESNHGRFGGATLSPDGESLPRIVGIALDGTRSAYVADTDGGRLDGDARYDRAVGPMQFIPSTWASWGVDGNGDGVADPFNIDDAALSAARYLCAAGGDLRTRAGQVAAVLAYNDSDAYLAQVLVLARAYATDVPVPTLPISGPTSGALPPVPPSDGVPVNPAAPPAGATRVPATVASAPSHPASTSTDHSAPKQPAPSRAAAPGGATTTTTPSASAPGPTATPTPAKPSGSPTTSAPAPNPVQTIVNGVLCTIGLLGLPICPTG